MRFAGKVALITGAASGIGAATARRLADEGAAIIAFDRDAAGRDVIDSLHVRCGAVHKFVRGDVTSERDVVQMFEGLRQEKRAAHVVVTCAGISPRSLAYEMDLEFWREVIDVNLTGTFLVGREALRRMRDTDGGVIVTVASELSATIVLYSGPWTTMTVAMFQALEGTSPGVASAAATVLIVFTIVPVALVFRLLQKHELSML